MIDGFKKREVVCMPIQYTLNMLGGNIRQEYRDYGTITIPYVEPIEKPPDDYLSRDWDKYHGWNDDDDLGDYLDMMDRYGEAEEGGNF